jgi:hypothetical protein
MRSQRAGLARLAAYQQVIVDNNLMLIYERSKYSRLPYQQVSSQSRSEYLNATQTPSISILSIPNKEESFQSPTHQGSIIEYRGFEPKSVANGNLGSHAKFNQ